MSKRACDCCRARRVKCDGRQPCDRCLFSSIPCTFAPPRKKGPKSGKIIDSLRERTEREKSPRQPIASSSLIPHLPPSIDLPTHRSSNYLHLSDSLLSSSLTTFFNRLHDLNPTIDRDSVVSRFSHKAHLYDPSLASLVLAISSIVLLLPEFQTNTAESDLMLNEAIKLHTPGAIGADLNLDSIATSMMVGSVLMAKGYSNAAYLRYKEAVGIAEIMGLDKSGTYESLGTDKERALRVISILIGAGRMCSLVQGKPFSMRLQPTTLVPPDIDDPLYLHRLSGITHLFETIDCDLIDCMNNSCSPHHCTFNILKAVEVQATLENVVPHPHQHEAEIADIYLTKRWLQAKVWQVCVTHSILLPGTTVKELGIDYPFYLINEARRDMLMVPLSALEANGRAMAVKLEELAQTVESVLALPQNGVELDSSRVEAVESVKAVRQMAGRLRQIVWVRCVRDRQVIGPVELSI